MTRAVIDLDDTLVKQAQKLTGLSKKVDLVKRQQRKGLLKFMGSGCWEGDLQQMRRNRS